MEFKLAILTLMTSNQEDALAGKILRVMNRSQAVDILEDHAVEAMKFAEKIRRDLDEETRHLPSNVIRLRPL